MPRENEYRTADELQAYVSGSATSTSLIAFYLGQLEYT